MSTFLFAAHPASGHLNPLLAIARQLRHDGHSATFVFSAPGPMARAPAAEGFPVVDIRPALGSLRLLLIPWLTGFRETCFAMDAMSRGMTHYARCVGRVIDAVSPEAVVADFAFRGAQLAAEWRGVPYAAVYVAGLSFKGVGVPPFGSGLPIGADWGEAGRRYEAEMAALERRLARRNVRACRRLGIGAAPIRSPLREPVSPYLNLVPSAEAVEAPRDRLPAHTCFIGPCTRVTGQAAAGFPFDRLDRERPKVYASLGTVFNNKPEVFQRLIAAFADERYQLIVSAGKAYRRLRSRALPARMILVESAPQVALLPRVDLVITHGGNNTVNETLAAGRPLLVMPVGGEQADNASRVVYLGAGLRADLNSPPLVIRECVDKLFAEPDVRQRAHAIAAELARTEGVVAASRLLQHLVATRAPVVRPEGCPLTLTGDLPAPWGQGSAA